jgi:cobalt-zinc-cadmium efflux system membrane fusion protein
MGVNARSMVVRGLGITVLLLIAAGGTALGILWGHAGQQRPVEAGLAPPSGSRIEAVPGRYDTLRVPASLLESGRFRTEAVVAAPPPEPMQLSGSIMLDPNRLARVHTLFNGQIVRIGLPGVMGEDTTKLSVIPGEGLRPGDFVRKNQVLAVIWSKDVGEKKSELIDQISQHRADKKVLERYKSVEPGVVTLNQLTQAERAAEASFNAVVKAERTLRSWGLEEREIETVVREAEKIVEGKGQRDRDLERSWAETTIRAPFDALIVEKNITIGDTVDPTIDLYKLADLSHMQVLAHAYEEELARLQQLRPSERGWEVRVDGSPNSKPFTGKFDKIGVVVDPTQHTGTVIGWVDNRDGKLLVGQFVTVRIPMPANKDLVAVPSRAVIEEEDGSAVYVRDPDAVDLFSRRKVAVAVRGREWIYLRRHPTEADAQAGAAAIEPGEVVVIRGALDLAAEFKDLRTGADNNR